MELKDLILGVDLDGVCADYYDRMREIAEEWFEQPQGSLTPLVSYGLPEWGIDPSKPEQYNSLHRFAVTQRELFRTCQMIPGARLYLRKLSDQGVRVRIITHRLFIEFAHNASVSQTVDWLDSQGIPYWDLCFMKAKEQVGANVYIDDAPHNVELMRTKGLYTICFSNSTNGHVGPPKAADWKEAYDLVLKWAQEH
jgi:5'(3')-deoxyribonucleotidase